MKEGYIKIIKNLILHFFLISSIKLVEKLIEFEMEGIEAIDRKDGIKIIKLPELTKEERDIIDPIVAPTSGLRIQIYDIIEENKKYYLPKRKFYLFLRVFRAICETFKEINQNLKILIYPKNVA